MQAEKWQRVERIFHEALEVDLSGRAEFIAARCGNDEELLREVESLVAADAPDARFLEEPAHQPHGEQTGQFPDSRIGQKFGHYKILEKIGAGGMGAIYLAERADDEFQKRAAVKIIKRGMDTDAILHRFRQERQILAALDHPHIARLLDGGTTADGLPFLVMEYIEGVPIDVYCRENAPDLTTRLELFRKVCAAVSFAHQKLVVHRDLKPSNILVTADGAPKLLDFGIAKLLNVTDTRATQTQQRVLTPAYASPEQLRGEPVSTATDVYSLGLILREILEPAENVEGRGPKKKLPDDLTAIVRTATHEDPVRRYGSAENLSEDIRRHLGGLPVSARTDTFGYRAGKFLRRNPVGVMALTIIFSLLIGGILLVSRQAQIAGRERLRAERRAENLRKLSSSFVVELHAAILNLPGSLLARQLLLTRAVEQLDVLAAESDGNPQLQNALAEGYFNLSQLPNINLADVDQNAQKGVAIYQNLLVAEPQNIAYRSQLAKGLTWQANVQRVRGDTAGALSLLQRATTILESVVADEPGVNQQRRLLQEVESQTGSILIVAGRAREALEISRKAQALGAELVRLDGIDDDFERMFAALHFEECKSLTYLGDYRTSLELLRADWQIVSGQSAAHPNDTRFRYEMWAYGRGLALAFEHLGDRQAALESLENALEIIDGLRRSSPEDVGYQRNTSFTHLALGQLLVRQNQAARALPHLVEALGMSEKIFARDPEKGETLEDLARIQAAFGNASVSLGKSVEGFRHLRESLGFFQKALDRDPENALFRRDFAETLGRIGSLTQKSRNPNERHAAPDFFRQSSAIWQDLQNKGILSYADTEQPKLAAQNLARFDALASN